MLTPVDWLDVPEKTEKPVSRVNTFRHSVGRHAFASLDFIEFQTAIP